LAEEYKCAACGMTFRTKEELEKHKKDAHEIMECIGVTRVQSELMAATKRAENRIGSDLAPGVLRSGSTCEAFLFFTDIG